MAEMSCESHFFSGNIANMIPEGLPSKRAARGPLLAHGLYSLPGIWPQFGTGTFTILHIKESSLRGSLILDLIPQLLLS